MPVFNRSDMKRVLIFIYNWFEKNRKTIPMTTTQPGIIGKIENSVKLFWESIKMEWHKLAPKLQTFITIALTVTDKILQLEGTATGELIASFFPKWITDLFPEIEKILHEAIVAISGLDGTEADIKVLIADFVNWLKSQPVLMQHATLVKLASIILGILDGNAQSESVYDKLIQDHIIRTKQEGGKLS